MSLKSRCECTHTHTWLLKQRYGYDGSWIPFFLSLGWLRLLWSVMDTERSYDNNKASINPTIFQDLKAEISLEQKPHLKFLKNLFLCELNTTVFLNVLPSTTEPNNLLLLQVMQVRHRSSCCCLSVISLLIVSYRLIWIVIECENDIPNEKWYIKRKKKCL